MCERELETEQRLQHIDLTSPSGHSRVSFSFSWCSTGGPGVQLSAGFLYRILSLSHLTSNSLISCPHRPRNCPLNLWNGMFDRHQAEITVMQFRGYSLPVHQSMSVSWAFTLSHFISQIHLRGFCRLLAIGMCHFLPVHHFEMACLAGSNVNIQHTYIYSTSAHIHTDMDTLTLSDGCKTFSVLEFMQNEFFYCCVF